MIQTLYIEEEVSGHPRTQEICSRFPSAARIPIARYGEIFNRKGQWVKFINDKSEEVTPENVDKTLKQFVGS